MLNFFYVIISILMFQIFSESTFANTDPQKKLPVLQEAGRIPVQWESTIKGGVSYTIQKEMLDTAFKSAVIQSARFRMLNDSLVETLWSTPNGRAQLEQDHEMDVLLSMTVITQADKVVLQVRLLNPKMQSLLVESEAKYRDWLMAASQAEINQVVAELLFRTINRIPMDVSITSIQGRYLTLSGGSKQNIVVGDKLELLKVGVKANHAVDGSWASFSSTKIGSAEIIETNENSSVAKIVGLAYENAAEVGDGAKVLGISSRRYFKPKKSELVDKQKYASSMIVENNPPTSDVTKGDPSPSSEDSGSSDSTIKEALSTAPDDVFIKAGFYKWSAKGVGSASAVFPTLLLNTLQFAARRELNENLIGEAEAGLYFGSTKNGNFSGLNLQAMLAHRDAMEIHPALKNSHWYAGGLFYLKTIGVGSESYGGMDLLAFGGRLGAMATVTFLKKDLEMNTAFNLVPLGFGQVGARGRKRSIASMFELGWFYQVMVDMGESSSWDFGGELGYRSNSMSLSGSDHLVEHGLSLMGLARYKF